MSQADELLATLSVDYTDEARIYVNDDRTITVPDELKHIAVQGDHNIETVTFDCPRYWDEHDFSQMKVYITYMRVDGFIDSYRTKNLRISEEDDTRILFDWTISGNVTKVSGNLSFLVYIESTSANPCWHSRLNQQMVVDEGLSATEQILRAPESIEAVLAQTTADYISAAKAEIEGKTAQSLASIPEDYTTVNNMAEEALREKSNAVKMEAEGETIVVNDSADNALFGLKVYGKTTQITTTGKNLAWPNINVKDYPYLGVVCSETEDGNILLRGTSTSNMWNRLASAELIAGKTYTLSAHKSVSLSVWDVTADGSFTVKPADIESITFVAPNTGSYSLCIENVSGVTFSAILANIMLSDGDEPLSWEPYSGGVASPSPQWPQGLASIDRDGSVTTQVSGKNLFRNATSSTTREGVTFTVNPDGSVLVNGTATATVQLDIGKFTPFVGYDYIFTSGQLTGGSNAAMYISDINGVADWKHHRHEWTTITSDPVRLAIYVTSGKTVNNCLLKPMIQVKTADTDETHEPYRDLQSVVASHPLRGIPVTSGGNYTDSDGQQWICDEIDFERGVYIQRIGRITVDDSMTYFYNTDNHFLHTGSDLFDNVAAWETRILSTHFMPVGNGIDMYDYGWFQFNGNGGIRFRIEGVDAVAALTAWLMDNVPEVMYPLVTPIETPLSDAELASFKMVRTHYPNTTVLNDSRAHMAIKYAADTKTYVDNSLSNATLVDTATGKLYRLTVTNGQMTVIAV